MSSSTAPMSAVYWARLAMLFGPAIRVSDAACSGRKHIRAAARVVLDEPTNGQGVQPFAHVPLIESCPSAICELVDGGRVAIVSNRPVR